MGMRPQGQTVRPPRGLQAFRTPVSKSSGKPVKSVAQGPDVGSVFLDVYSVACRERPGTWQERV